MGLALTDPRVERVALHPLLALGAVQPPVEIAEGPVLPESALPVSLFVPPERLGPLQSLQHILKKAWTDLLRAAHCRGRLVAPDEAQPILEAIARAVVERDPALGATVAPLDDPFRLEPRAPLQIESVCYPLTALRLDVDREGRAGRQPAPFALGPSPGALAECGRLLGLITAGEPPSTIARYLEEAQIARRLFARLVADELLAAAPAERRLGHELPPGTIAHLGHATLLANLGGRFILVDPWLPPASVTDAPPPPAAAELPRLDAILLTHHHWDHVHVETLMQLDKRVPVLLPAQPAGRAVTARTDLLLRYLGFSDLRPLSHGESAQFGEGGRVTAAPFFGEDPTRIGYAGNCYVLEHAGAAALVHVDSASDAHGRSLASTGAARALRERFGALSPVFATRRQELGALIEYGWEALLQPAHEWPRPTENCCNDPAALAALVEATGARCLALYSEGGAGWFPEWTNFLASDGSPFHRPYQHLWRELLEFEGTARAAGAETLLSRPYQRYRIGASADGRCLPRGAPNTY